MCSPSIICVQTSTMFRSFSYFFDHLCFVQGTFLPRPCLIQGMNQGTRCAPSTLFKASLALFKALHFHSLDHLMEWFKPQPSYFLAHTLSFSKVQDNAWSMRWSKSSLILGEFALALTLKIHWCWWSTFINRSKIIIWSSNI